MSARSVFVVFGAAGEWCDYRRWAVCAFESRKSETYRRARKRYRVTNAGRAALAANEKIA